MQFLRSQAESPGDLICRNRCHRSGFDVVQSLLRNSSVFLVNHCFVPFDKLRGHDRSSALLIATSGDESDLSTERSAINSIGEVIPCIAH